MTIKFLNEGKEISKVEALLTLGIEKYTEAVMMITEKYPAEERRDYSEIIRNVENGIQIKASRK